MGCDCCRDSDGRPLLRTDGPRAGINCPPPPASLDPTFVSLTVLTETHCRAGNDGFAGGSTVEGNLVFNMVRETGDHGPYNSWDRQPYLTHSGHRDGYPDSVKHGTSGASILKQHDLITKNVFINGYNGVWTIDHDDGSQCRIVILSRFVALSVSLIQKASPFQTSMTRKTSWCLVRTATVFRHHAGV